MFVDSGRLKQILGLSLPIMGGMLSQNILNLVDTAMVGRLGAPAVAAVGLGGFANFFSISIILGLSAGVQAMAARRMGEGAIERAAVPLNGGIMLALLGGLPLGLGLAYFTPVWFPWLVSDPAVVAEGVPYVQARLCAAFAVGINFSFRGFWNGIRKSYVYMGTLVVMHVVNIAGNYVLIFGNFGAPALGTLGAGLASALSVVTGSLFYLVMGFVHVRPLGFLQRLPDAASLLTLIRISIPNSVQQLFFSGGLFTLFLIIESVGTAELAAANIIVNIMLVGYLPAIGLGLGAATLVGQALGRGEPDDARSWGWDVVRVAVVLLTVVGLPMVIFPEAIIGFFITGEGSADVIELASVPLMITGAGMIIEAFGLVLMNALLGAGDSRSVMVASVFMQWCVFLPVVGLLAWLGYGLIVLWSVNIGYRLVLALIFVALWHAGRWQKVQV